MMRIVLDWQVSDRFGWGVYGLNMALEWARDPEIEASSTSQVDMGRLGIDALRKHAIRPFAERSGFRRARAIEIAALGNGMLPAPGNRKIAAVFFEEFLDREAIERAKAYDLIVTGSTWNERLLQAEGLKGVKTILQGVDPTLFHPAARRGLFPDRFLIFSGGKAEPRKGQDLVVRAFRIFAQRHKDATLVTAWHSPWPALAAGMDLDLSSVRDQVIDLGAVPNAQLPAIYRECDVAVFASRAEGGTNLPAMECLACGVPTILSSNTGHRDIISRPGAIALVRQTPCENWDEWRESDVDEIVEQLELARRVRYRRASKVPLGNRMTWTRTAMELAAAVKSVTTKGET